MQDCRRTFGSTWVKKKSLFFPVIIILRGISLLPAGIWEFKIYPDRSSKYTSQNISGKVISDKHLFEHAKNGNSWDTLLDLSSRRRANCMGHAVTETDVDRYAIKHLRFTQETRFPRFGRFID